jgi:hypothetical protein
MMEAERGWDDGMGVEETDAVWEVNPDSLNMGKCSS